MTNIAADAPMTSQLLMGNEAIARGALEAGIGVATAYPGNPSSEIIGSLAQVAKDSNLIVEWSINEKVALETATAASLSNVRAISAMKQNGLNVALDFLANLNLTGVKSGLVLVVCDDPGGISSTNEQDSRHIAKILDLPLLEPGTFQEAKDMTKWAFELSEEIANICLIRSVTRISHARGNVLFGDLPLRKERAFFDTSRRPYASIVTTTPSKLHQKLHQNLPKISEIYEQSPFNGYAGPQDPELLIVTCGSGWFYSKEAVEILSRQDAIGILKLGTTWPLKKWSFYGKASGHVDPFGEINTDIVIDAIAAIVKINYSPSEVEYQKKSQKISEQIIFPRESQFCAGCPHRTTFWAIKDALKVDGREGFVVGDIGCYSMALAATGFTQIKTVHAMGSGIGIASGLGDLMQLGFHQPVLAVCGDSTFFHAVIPGLINAVHNQSDLILVVLDNAGTAMTGFQPHPGVNVNAKGDPSPPIDIVKLCHALDVPVLVTDAYDIKGTTEKLLDLLSDQGKPRVLISRRECQLIRAKKKNPLYKVQVNPDRCIGDTCGCRKFCTRVFRCPGLIWDRNTGKAEIDEAVCSGCGVCVDICSQSAISKESN
jgi:indolepyruvate ferredoxin oxidoreductase alpha subunit